MQLIIISIFVFLFIGLQELKTQVTSTIQNQNDSDSSKTSDSYSQTYERPDWKEVKVDFLNSYYEQDGDNSAVTGGIGTERLTDFTQKLKISFPTSPKLRVSATGAYDYYSSASTDNIDNIRSSDSRSDIRAQLTVAATYKSNKNKSFGMFLGTSVEYDYTSINGGVNLSLLSNDENKSLTASFQAFIDNWSIIYPSEIRRQVNLPNSSRQSYNLAFQYSQIINRKLQVAVMPEITLMNGLLSTPFHRVYFDNTESVDIERLPSERIKIPLGLRLNYYISDNLIVRSYLRQYWDTWGMSAQTVNLELPVKLNRFFAIYPHVRYHQQSAVDYFKPYKGHVSTDQFYTSDYDLSELNSWTYGLGIIWGQSDGLLSIKTLLNKNRALKLDSINIKYGHYKRSTGLSANIVSLGLKFSL